MRHTNSLLIAVACGVFGPQLACSSNNGAEASATGTGGSQVGLGGSGAGNDQSQYQVSSGGSRAANTGTLTSNSSGGSDPNSTGCAQQNVPIQALPPDIMIVQDRSLSMTDDANDQPCAGGTASGDGNCGAASKWNQTIPAIESVVQATQNTVNRGSGG